MVTKSVSNVNGQTSTISVALRSVSVWSLIMAAETLNGAVRESVLAPPFGSTLARQVSFGIALVLIISIAVLFIDWIQAIRDHQKLLVGAIWVTLTFCFEVVLGVFVLGLPWERITSDYDLSRGGLMSIGLIFMLFAPILASKLREPVNL